MEIKYEPVFGDQSLFDNASDDAVLAIKETISGRIHFVTNKGWIKSGLNHERYIGISDNGIAMRRIIPEPKRWTIEDQKAGNLPEVGCRVSFCHKFNTNWRAGEIKYIDNQIAFIKTDDIDRPFIYEVDRVEFKPIESPEEKAARLREEWVSKATFMRTYEIYDNLLSGDLPVPVREE